ncbi:MAG: hypothetical protein Pg6A_17340 [Termitinemataceae bacterium]|nr:MAG: hypothetical protein Pg6A_17340 [Termitinemataceae bacterium]
MNRIFIFIAFVLIYPQGIKAQFEGLLSSEIRIKLLNTGFLSEANFKPDAPLSLMPDHKALLQIVSQARKELSPGVIVEGLAFCPKSKAAAGRWDAKEKTALFNAALSLSTLAGIRYYSPSRNQTRLFYKTSTVIDSLESQNPVRDPVFTESKLPYSFLIYAKQEDLTFGENLYQYEYKNYEDAIIFSQTNLTPMRYGVLPVLGEKKLRTIITVIDIENYLLLYMVSMADATMFPGIKSRINQSFSSRSEAVLKWFIAKANAIYSK